MVALKITKVGEAFAVVLTEERGEALGVAEGATLYAQQSEDGTVTLSGGRAMSFEARRARGRAFIARYEETLKDLAK
jgi:hypothetical protein